MKSNLKYDGKILQGTINNKEVLVTRHSDDVGDLEKACMMALLQSVGYTYSDVKALYRSVKKQWIPKINEKYYYITDVWEIDDTYNDDYRIDKERIKNGNCFKTLKEAQTTLNKIRIF